jgi:hypothetical protein
VAEAELWLGCRVVGEGWREVALVALVGVGPLAKRSCNETLSFSRATTTPMKVSTPTMPNPIVLAADQRIGWNVIRAAIR